MPFLKRKSIKAFSVSFSLLTVAALILLALPGDAVAQLPSLDPNLVRNAVRQMGMDTLSSVIVTDPAGLTGFERITPLVADPLTNPPTPGPRRHPGKLTLPPTGLRYREPRCRYWAKPSSGTSR